MKYIVNFSLYHIPSPSGNSEECKIYDVDDITIEKVIDMYIKEKGMSKEDFLFEYGIYVKSIYPVEK